MTECAAPLCHKEAIGRHGQYPVCEQHEEQTWQPSIPPQLMAQMLSVMERLKEER